MIEHGHHAAFDIGWFRKIGGYDPTFSHNEDPEYDHRLALAGGKIWLDGEIRLKYIMRPSNSGLFRQYRNYGRGRMRTLKKHRMMPKTRQVLPIALVANLIFSTLLGWLVHPLLYLGTAAYAAILLAVSIALAFKHRSFCAFWAGPALATMHISWAFGALEKFFSSH